eukprot:gnl/MRDRNA2_/MRDRNA2_100518_c0_seq1.p1 gnl/MRDRNA2_/MRDRNA2_100518_c0~~gnl/MRDRNA2_/MRDRNA2_100518_c0_seq1.p1  ORF type:complete len:332 (+),score=112.09 gnl/MRDRNA2_/MRDRNA2_100518_c0_seq1:117-1112(+)
MSRPRKMLQSLMLLLAVLWSAEAMTPAQEAQRNEDAYDELLAQKEQMEGGEDDEQAPPEEEPSFTPEQLSKLHDKMDKNGDGKVSIDEIKDFNDDVDLGMANGDTGQILQEFDKDGDGKIGIDEYITEESPFADLDAMGGEGDDDQAQMEAAKAKEAVHMEMQQNMFKAADHDGDGFLSHDEFRGLVHPETNHKVLIETVKVVMKEKDLDKDGKLTLAEFFEHHDPGYTDEKPEGMEEDDEMDGLHEMQKQEQQNFAWLDKDKDGLLDIHEVLRWESGESNVRQSWAALFDFADADKDGHITKKELVDAHPQVIESEAHNTMKFWNEHLEL